MMNDIEICENKEQCKREQQRLTDCLAEIKGIYKDILKYATSTETAWWQGNKHDDFVRKMIMRKDQFDNLAKQVQREAQFFDHWEKSLGKLNSIFEDLLSIIGRLD